KLARCQIAARLSLHDLDDANDAVGFDHNSVSRAVSRFAETPWEMVEILFLERVQTSPPVVVVNRPHGPEGIGIATPIAAVGARAAPAGAANVIPNGMLIHSLLSRHLVGMLGTEDIFPIHSASACRIRKRVRGFDISSGQALKLCRVVSPRT